MTDTRAEPPTPPGDTDAVVVRLGPGRFAVDLASVAEVGRVPPLTRVPGVPGWVAGVANWRGRVLPVLDLRALLGADADLATPKARLLVLAAHGVTAGLLVDAVEGTETLAGQVEPYPPALASRGSRLLAGQVPRPDGPIAVLDVAAVAALRDQLPRRGVA